MFLIYKLTFTNGKSYIGQTVRNWNRRFCQHRRAAIAHDSQLAVHCAWRKYGEPTVEFLGKYSTIEELHDAEREAIKLHNTLSPNGYNISYGGDTAPSSNPEVAAKIAAKAKGRGHTAETKALMSEGIKQRWLNPEYREKVMRGVEASKTKELSERRGVNMKRIWEQKKANGYKMPETQKQKLREKFISDETKQKMSESAKKRKREPRSAETCAKLAESAKRQWLDPEARKRRGEAISAALKAKYANMTPEEHAKFMEQRLRGAATLKAKSA